jgi:hypothetical protein
MKKQKIVVILASSLLLTACGGSVEGSSASNAGSASSTAASSSTPIVPVGGNSIAVASASPKLASAVANLGTKGAIGLNLSGLTLDEVSSTSVPVTGAEASSISVSTVTTSSSIHNGYLKAAATGLTSAKASDVKASLSLGGDLAYSTNMPINGASSSLAYTGTGLSAAAYISDSTVYADLSNEKSVALVNQVIALIQSMMSKSSTFSSNSIPVAMADDVAATSSAAMGLVAGKYNLGPAFLQNATYPLLNDDVKKSLTSFSAQLQGYVDAYASYLSAQSYANGDYALTLTLDKNKVLQLLAASTLGMSSVPESTKSMLSTYTALVNAATFNAFSVGFLFNETSLKAINCDIDVAFSATYAQLAGSAATSLPSDVANAQNSGSLKFAFNLAILTGEDVVVTLPDDLATYTVMATRQ